MKNEITTYTNEVNALTINPDFTNKELNKYTTKIAKAMVKGSKAMYDIATSLLVINNNEYYTDDFTNITEYAEKTFGYKKSATYNLLAVARRFLVDNTRTIFVEDGAPDFTVPQLSLMLPIDSVEVIENAVADKLITPDMKLTEIKKVVQTLKDGETTENEVSEENNGDSETASSETKHFYIYVNGLSTPDVECDTEKELIKEIKSLLKETDNNVTLRISTTPENI